MKTKVNLIAVFDKAEQNILFCLRRKDPFKGKFNFVGGKIGQNEDHLSAAYRELFEETGIEKTDISLFHVMDIIYYDTDTLLEVYAGTLNKDKHVTGEENKLFWLPVDENFADERFAGQGNISHILAQIKTYKLSAIS